MVETEPEMSLFPCPGKVKSSHFADETISSAVARPFFLFTRFVNTRRSSAPLAITKAGAARTDFDRTLERVLCPSSVPGKIRSPGHEGRRWADWAANRCER